MKAKSKTPAQSYTVYFGGELFDLKDLIGNAYLAEAIYEKSHGKFRCHLPQDFELRGLHPQVIRDQDIESLYGCDLALFNFDGTELDSGTLVEFMIAKMADIPTVILRTDLRGAGDQGARRDPWNLMASFYPRTIVLRAASLIDYRTLQQKRLRKASSDVIRLAGQHASATAAIVCDRLAAQIIKAFAKVMAEPARLPAELREPVYAWLALMPGLRGKPKALRKQLETALAAKVAKGLL